MTKRVIALFLVCILAIPLLVVPASADSLYESQWMNLLEYDSVDTDGNFFTFSGSYTVSLTLPVETNLYYIDVVVKSTQAVTVSAILGTQTATLEVARIGSSNTYRVYGRLPAGNYTTLNLKFTSSATTSCTLLRCDVTAGELLSYPTLGRLQVSTVSGTSTQTMASPASPVTGTLVDGTAQTVETYFAYIYLNNWKYYDFVDIFFDAYTCTINTLSVYLGGVSIPFDVCYLNDANAVNGYDSVQRYVRVRCDLRGLDRTATSLPTLSIQGTFYSPSSYVRLSAVTGFVAVNNINPVTYFLRNLWNTVETGFFNVSKWIANQSSKLGSILNTGFNNISTWISEQTNAFLSLGEGEADDFNNQAATDATEWSEALDEIEKATMPDTDDLDIDLEHQIDGYDAEIGDLIKVFFQNEYIYVVFLLAFTFALISFTVFGKR